MARYWTSYLHAIVALIDLQFTLLILLCERVILSYQYSEPQQTHREVDLNLRLEHARLVHLFTPLPACGIQYYRARNVPPRPNCGILIVYSARHIVHAPTCYSSSGSYSVVLTPPRRYLMDQCIMLKAQRSALSRVLPAVIHSFNAKPCNLLHILKQMKDKSTLFYNKMQQSKVGL